MAEMNRLPDVDEMRRFLGLCLAYINRDSDAYNLLASDQNAAEVARIGVATAVTLAQYFSAFAAFLAVAAGETFAVLVEEEARSTLDELAKSETEWSDSTKAIHSLSVRYLQKFAMNVARSED